MKILKLSIIYKVSFPNKKCYIGRTCSKLSHRKSDHYSDARNGSKLAFHRALLKYEGFEIWEILHDSILPENIADLEIEEVKLNNSFIKNHGYNLTLGGEGTLGHIVSKKERDRRSKLYVGRKLPCRSEEWRKNISSAKMGDKNPCYGKSPPNKGKSSKEFMKDSYNNYLKTRQIFHKKIISVDEKGEVVLCFKSIIDAHLFFGYRCKSVLQNYIKNSKKVKGHLLKYL